MHTVRSQSGFSLIELAVVLVIVGLLVGGGIAALDATTEQSRRSDQQRQLSEVREALYGFSMSQGRLPCPDTDDDGEENDPCDSGPPGTIGGVLPWATLGLGRRDSWGNPLRYRVDRDFAGSAPIDGSSFDLGTIGNLSVVDGDGDSIVSVSPPVSGAPAVILSFGPQGGQAWGGALPCSVTSPPAGFSADEAENCDDDGEFVDAGYRDADATDARFDDQLIWLSAPVLMSRMVAAGRLP